VTIDGEITLTVRMAVLVTAPRTAPIVTRVWADTRVVVMGNVAVVAPARTVTLASTVATPVFELLRLTVVPPVGAGLDNVTVPVEPNPPKTLLGARASIVKTGALTVSTAVLATPSVAV